eukprot:Phypoly_transcript_22329.p1 GENE.Phypoly_transcript_22329~~Phypoly_transcript_22329.p1  ORF type:complete len:198 (+),score=29.95 Phypoly_transcript_22329:78-596(+)
MAPPTKISQTHRIRRAKRAKPPTVRPSITPGTVLILLRGVYAGRRVIYVKQLPGSGNLLVTGPRYFNGVPFTRVPQSAVIATSTKIDISGVDSKGITDGLFKATVRRAAKKSEEHFFQKDKPTEQKRQAQNLISSAADKKIVEAVKKVPQLKKYLARNFFLARGDRPHAMKF